MPDRIFSGKYVVQEEIAKGGMGVIYKALDRTLNRLVAIKVIHEHFSGDAFNRFMLDLDPASSPDFNLIRHRRADPPPKPRSRPGEIHEPHTGA